MAGIQIAIQTLYSSAWQLLCGAMRKKPIYLGMDTGLYRGYEGNIKSVEI